MAYRRSSVVRPNYANNGRRIKKQDFTDLVYEQMDGLDDNNKATNTRIDHNESTIASLQVTQLTGLVGFTTIASMQSDLAHIAKTIAFVASDPVPANNGYYMKNGISGSGDWGVKLNYTPQVNKSNITGLDVEIADINDTVSAVQTLPTIDEFVYVIADTGGRIAFGIQPNGITRFAGIGADSANHVLDVYDKNGIIDTIQRVIDDVAWAITDEYGKSPLAVLMDGSLAIPGARCCNIDDYAFAITDEDGGVAFAINLDGSLASNKKMINGKFSAEILFFPCYGQSWSCGIEGVAITFVQRFDNLSFNGGVRVQSISDDPAVVYTSLIPLVERSDVGTPEFPTFYSGETPVAGQTDMIKELISSENNISHTQQTYQLLGTAPGEGSKNLEDLMKPSTYYTRLLNQITYGFQLAQASGKLFNVPAVSWIQLYAYNDANYADILEQLRVQIDSDAKLITGQTNNVKLITWQMFPGWNTDTSLILYDRYVKASEVHPDIICACPSYFLDQMSHASLHLTPTSNKWLGAYFGLVYKRVIIDELDWQPLKPISFVHQGKVLLVKFHVIQPPLVFDISRVAQNENYGFNLFNTSGVEIPIESISISGPDTIKIVAQSTLSPTDHLIYASKGDGWDRHIGKRGNLRDSQGDYIVFDGDGLNLPMHNWCVVFDKIIG